MVAPVVVSPLQFFEVTIQMLDTHLVERAHQRPLEQAPDAFNAVGVHVAHNPLLHGVIDRLMPGIVVADPEIGLEFVGVDGFGFVFNGAVDEGIEGVALSQASVLSDDQGSVPAPEEAARTIKGRCRRLWCAECGGAGETSSARTSGAVAVQGRRVKGGNK